MFNRTMNWLSITSGSLLATLLLITSAQAADTISASNSLNSTLDLHSPNQLIALRNKKRPKRKVKSKPKTTATRTPTTSTNFTQIDRSSPPTSTQIAPTNVTQSTPPAPSQPTTQNPSTPTEIAPPNAPAIPTPGVNKFVVTTKLRGEVVFGVTGTLAGDYSRNTAFGQRTRLELKTDLGSGILTTRLQAVGLGLSNRTPVTNNAIETPEGSLGWTDGTTNSSIGIDQLKYDFALSPQTQILVSANASAADDFADTMNPYFDGDGTDGANGAISLFGNRPSIYFTIQGTGAAIRHKFSDTAEVSVGYLARTGNNPAPGNGLFGGGYGALAQLSLHTSKNSKVGLTYIRSFNSDFGTGSTNANLGGLSNSYGLQGSVLVSPQLSLGAWAGYTQNQAGGGDRQIWNWALTAAAPDLGGKGNLAGFLVGQEPRVTASNIDPATGNNTTDTKAGLHIEGFYQFKVNDNLSITPGIIYLTAPNQDANSSGAVIGALRTTFSF